MCISSWILAIATCKFKISLFCSPLTPLYFLIILFFLIITHANYASFEFSSFEPNISCINYEGNATVSTKVIQLTTDKLSNSAIGNAGRVMYCEPIHLWDKASGNLCHFYTTFSFAIDSHMLEDYGDGLAFFLSVVNFPFLEAGGGGLGLVRENTTSRYPFVAIEFDTYSNSWDPSYKHVGININSVMSNATTLWLSRVEDGSRIYVSIKYDSTLKSFTVNFTGYSGTQTIQQYFVHVIDLRDHLPEWVQIGFSASTGRSIEKHTLYSWYFTSNLQVNHNPIDDMAPIPNPPLIDDPKVYASTDSAKKGAGLIVGIAVGGCISVGMILFLLYFLLWNQKGREENDDKNKYDFSIDDFEKSTGPQKLSFYEEEKLGAGGSGTVYRGFLKELASYVAVKRISAGCSKQGIREYSSEIWIISQLRHRNLVQLLGWCHESKELLLVYELMPNGSLDSHLFKRDRLLTWEMRYDIAQGVASGSLYLQEEWQQLVLHRDIKSSNIMLDSNFNAKLGDFGLARFVDHGLVTVGPWCAHPDGKFRPSIRHVIQVLNFETSLPVLPSKIPVPTYLSPAVDNSSLSFSGSTTIS